MALEAIVYSQDPLLSYFCKDLYGSLAGSSLNHDFSNHCSCQFEKPCMYKNGDFIHHHHPSIPLSSIANASPLFVSVSEWDHNNQYPANSSSETYVAEQEHNLGSGTEIIISPGSAAAAGGVSGGGGKRKRRRRRSVKNEEEVENQRMTHIAVERNRRKQMNEYLAVIRTLMPTSYVQRGDQASIIGGAINYVKELEQQLHSLESDKRIKKQHQLQPDSDLTTSPNQPPIFADFFTFPQFSTRSSNDSDNYATITDNSDKSSSSFGHGGHEIEVTLLDGHANVKILTKRQSKQLLKLVASFHSICRFSVLHLNVTTTVDDLILYSFSLKAEEGSQLNSAEEIAAAINQILTRVQGGSSLD